MPLSFVVVCEAPADRETACGLADRVVCSEIDWIEEALLESLRTWCGLGEHDSQLLWKDVPRMARERGLRAHGHFEGKPGVADAHVGRLALLLIKLNRRELHAVLLIRDDDRDTARRQGLEQARGAVHLGVPVVIGLAHTKRECWVLAGFEPRDEKEQQRLSELRQELGFDPCSPAEKLIAKHEHDKKSAKRVLQILTDGDKGRETECWRSCNLTVLENRGQSTGLAEYLKEVRIALVPLFTKS